jgi:DNA adenine methylase
MLIRYPGSKDRISNEVFELFPDDMKPSFPLWMSAGKREYREPFFGAGAIGLRILESLPPASRAFINDRDPGIAALWRAVHDSPSELCACIASHRPSIGFYRQCVDTDGDPKLDPIERAFRKLVLHQQSFSGLGAKAGGPLGGWGQRGSEKYNLECRWNPVSLQVCVIKIAEILSRHTLRISCSDFESVISTDNQLAFHYLDPPYYEKGPDLYKFSMGPKDHLRLSKVLRRCRGLWALSYDDHPEVRKLYDGFPIHQISLRYTVSVRRGVTRKNKEIVITNYELHR